MIVTLIVAFFLPFVRVILAVAAPLALPAALIVTFPAATETVATFLLDVLAVTLVVSPKLSSALYVIVALLPALSFTLFLLTESVE